MAELLSEAVFKSGEFLLDSYSPTRTNCRVILLCIYIYIAGFDSVSDLVAWGSFLKVGFGHPLLPIPPLWSAVWGLFAVSGLLLAMVSTSHEVMSIFHLKGSFCKSHAEMMPLVGLLFEDIPMLVLALLYGLSQYTCSGRTITESSDALVPILISSIATALATFWRLILTLLKLRKNKDETRGGNGTETETATDTGGGNNSIQNGTQSLVVPGKQLCSLRCLFRCCYKTAIFIFGATVCLFSIMVVVIVTYLMRRENHYLIHRPRDPLLIFTSRPSTRVLVNASTVIDNGSASVLYDNHCLVLFQYQPSQHRVVYNFAEVGTGNNSQCDIGRVAVGCRGQFSNLFYGSYKFSGANGEVERLHEVCLAVHVILPHITSRPVWDPGLVVRCGAQ